MLLQLCMEVITHCIGCNPCYNGMLLQLERSAYLLSIRCNPCYNGMLLQYGPVHVCYRRVVILVIMECCYNRERRGKENSGVVILVIMECCYNLCPQVSV